jgi:hypothetical protein
MYAKATCGADALRSSPRPAILAAALGAVITLLFGRMAVADDAEVLANCPVVGDTADPKIQAVNTLKRRMMLPTPTDIDPRVNLEALVAPGDDTHRWDDRRGATIEGFVADVKVGGIESVNCHTRDPAFRDTHIELTLDAMANDETTYVIVEVTPQFRQKVAQQGLDWSTRTLRQTLLGRWVRISGWLMFDSEHKQNAKNTASGGAHIWRATVWEVHPITSIQVLPGKPQ